MTQSRRNFSEALLFSEEYRRAPGCFVDSPDAPEWARQMARRGMAAFRDSARHGHRAELLMGADIQGTGNGKRAVNFQFAMKLDPYILQGNQDFGNCTSWATREDIGCCIAADMATGRPHDYTHRPGTAVIYGSRGTSQQGMDLGTAARVVTTLGISLEKDYPGIADLSTEDKDEKAGNNWGARGVPKALLDAIAGNIIETAAEVTEKEAVKDLLQSGYFAITGSTRTAKSAGDPVSPVGPVGGHCQALIGYDDTDEFREWYAKTTGKKLAEGVFIFDQSWGPDWLKVTNWPTELWGPRPEGAFVLKESDGMQLVSTQYGGAIAFSRVKGFPARTMPDWRAAEYL